eukprot:UN09538
MSNTHSNKTKLNVKIEVVEILRTNLLPMLYLKATKEIKKGQEIYSPYNNAHDLVARRVQQASR